MTKHTYTGEWGEHTVDIQQELDTLKENDMLLTKKRGLIEQLTNELEGISRARGSRHYSSAALLDYVIVHRLYRPLSDLKGIGYAKIKHAVLIDADGGASHLYGNNDASYNYYNVVLTKKGNIVVSKPHKPVTILYNEGNMTTVNIDGIEPVINDCVEDHKYIVGIIDLELFVHPKPIKKDDDDEYGEYDEHTTRVVPGYNLYDIITAHLNKRNEKA